MWVLFAGIRLAAFRDRNGALDERSGDAGLLAAPPDPFRQQLVRGGRSWLLRQPVVVHVGKQGPDAVRRDRVHGGRMRGADNEGEGNVQVIVPGVRS